MCKFIGKSNERILWKLSKKEIVRLYSIVHVAMETTKTSNFNCRSKSFISVFFTCQVSACELQPFSCYDLANDIYLQTAKTVFSHLLLKNFVCNVIAPDAPYPLAASESPRSEDKSPSMQKMHLSCVLIVLRLWYRLFIDEFFRLKTLVVNLNSVGSSALAMEDKIS